MRRLVLILACLLSVVAKGQILLWDSPAWKQAQDDTVTYYECFRSQLPNVEQRSSWMFDKLAVLDSVQMNPIGRKGKDSKVVTAEKKLSTRVDILLPDWIWQDVQQDTSGNTYCQAWSMGSTELFFKGMMSSEDAPFSAVEGKNTLRHQKFHLGDLDSVDIKVNGNVWRKKMKLLKKGSLRLPAQKLSEVFLFKEEYFQLKGDSIEPVKAVYWKWYKRNSLSPVMILKEEEQEGMSSISKLLVDAQYCDPTQMGFEQMNSASYESKIPVGVLPNPTSGLAILNYTVDSPSHMQILVYSASGELVSKQAFDNSSSGVCTHTMNFSEYENGDYWVYMRNARQSGLCKVTVDK